MKMSNKSAAAFVLLMWGALIAPNAYADDCQGNCPENGEGGGQEQTQGQAQGQLQGQAQGQLQGQGQSQTSVNVLSNTNTNANLATSNSNSAGGQGGAASAQGGQGGSAKASNSLSNVANWSYSESERPVDSAYAPAINPTSPCMGSSSAGGQGMNIGLSFGSSWRDRECEKREAFRMGMQSGRPDIEAAAMAVYMSLDVVQAVLEGDEEAASVPVSSNTVSDARPATLP